MNDRLVRIARQHLETIRLLGVDFVPVPVATPRLALRPKPCHPEVHVMASSTQQLALGYAGEPAPELAPGEKPQALQELAARHDAECPHCTAATAHTRTVFGEGDANADLVFVGEAPGEEEDRTGRPFVGRAGRKLDDMIKAMGLRREDVYIANVLKSRPPGNRTPLPTEVDGCSPFLAQQIRIIRPRVVVALGGPAAKWILRTGEGITRLRGAWGLYIDGSLSVPVMPTFHPAYLLRSYTVDTRGKVWSDMKAVLVKLGISAE